MNNKKGIEQKLPDSCPHCGQKLSPWQQVLLKVDRAITCKNCWYRIYLPAPLEDSSPEGSSEEKKIED